MQVKLTFSANFSDPIYLLIEARSTCVGNISLLADYKDVLVDRTISGVEMTATVFSPDASGGSHIELAYILFETKVTAVFNSNQPTVDSSSNQVIFYGADFLKGPRGSAYGLAHPSTVPYHPSTHTDSSYRTSGSVVGCLSSKKVRLFAGDWIGYRFEASESALYNFSMVAACAPTLQQYFLWMNGSNTAHVATFLSNETAGNSIYLTAGNHTLRLHHTWRSGISTSATYCDIEKFLVSAMTPTGSTVSYNSSKRTTLPGTISAVDFVSSETFAPLLDGPSKHGNVTSRLETTVPLSVIDGAGFVVLYRLIEAGGGMRLSYLVSGGSGVIYGLNLTLSSQSFMYSSYPGYQYSVSTEVYIDGVHSGSLGKMAYSNAMTTPTFGVRTQSLFFNGVVVPAGDHLLTLHITAVDPCSESDCPLFYLKELVFTPYGSSFTGTIPTAPYRLDAEDFDKGIFSTTVNEGNLTDYRRTVHEDGASLYSNGEQRYVRLGYEEGLYFAMYIPQWFVDEDKKSNMEITIFGRSSKNYGLDYLSHTSAGPALDVCNVATEQERMRFQFTSSASSGPFAETSNYGLDSGAVRFRAGYAIVSITGCTSGEILNIDYLASYPKKGPFVVSAQDQFRLGSPLPPLTSTFNLTHFDWNGFSLTGTHTIGKTFRPDVRYSDLSTRTPPGALALNGGIWSSAKDTYLTESEYVRFQFQPSSADLRFHVYFSGDASCPAPDTAHGYVFKIYFCDGPMCNTANIVRYFEYFSFNTTGFETRKWLSTLFLTASEHSRTAHLWVVFGSGCTVSSAAEVAFEEVPADFTRSPYRMAPITPNSTDSYVPAWQYDYGGNGLAYWTPGYRSSSTSVYRPGDDVDVEDNGFIHIDPAISETEWIGYTLDLQDEATAANSLIPLRVVFVLDTTSGGITAGVSLQLRLTIDGNASLAFHHSLDLQTLFMTKNLDMMGGNPVFVSKGKHHFNFSFSCTFAETEGYVTFWWEGFSLLGARNSNSVASSSSASSSATDTPTPTTEPVYWRYRMEVTGTGWPYLGLDTNETVFNEFKSAFQTDLDRSFGTVWVETSTAPGLEVATSGRRRAEIPILRVYFTSYESPTLLATLRALQQKAEIFPTAQQLYRLRTGHTDTVEVHAIQWSNGVSISEPPPTTQTDTPTSSRTESDTLLGLDKPVGIGALAAIGFVVVVVLVVVVLCVRRSKQIHGPKTPQIEVPFPEIVDQRDVEWAQDVATLQQMVESGAPEGQVIAQANKCRLQALAFHPQRPEGPFLNTLKALSSQLAQFFHPRTTREIGLLLSICAVHTAQKSLARKVPLDFDEKQSWIEELKNIRHSLTRGEDAAKSSKSGFHTAGLDFALDVTLECINVTETYLNRDETEETVRVLGAAIAACMGDYGPLLSICNETAAMGRRQAEGWFPQLVRYSVLQPTLADQRPLVLLMLKESPRANWHSIYQWLLLLDSVVATEDTELQADALLAIQTSNFVRHTSWRVREKVAETVSQLAQSPSTQTGAVSLLTELKLTERDPRVCYTLENASKEARIQELFKQHKRVAEDTANRVLSFQRALVHESHDRLQNWVTPSADGPVLLDSELQGHYYQNQQHRTRFEEVRQNCATLAAELELSAPLTENMSLSLSGSGSSEFGAIKEAMETMQGKMLLDDTECSDETCCHNISERAKAVEAKTSQLQGNSQKAFVELCEGLKDPLSEVVEKFCRPGHESFLLLSDVLTSLTALEALPNDPSESHFLTAIRDIEDRLALAFEKLEIHYDTAAAQPLPRELSGTNLGTIPASALTFETGPEAVLGSGGFGTVLKATHEGRQVAVKVIRDVSKTVFDAAMGEAKLQARLCHPNVVALYGASVAGSQLSLVMEQCTSGVLTRVLFDQDMKLGHNEKTKYSQQLASAMCYLHCSTKDPLSGEATKILHGDLKPANILLDSEGNLKLTDFGHSTVRTTSMSYGTSAGGHRRGTLGYQSPESFRGERLTTRSDVFSFGVVLYEIWTRKKAFGSERAVEEAMASGTMPPLTLLKNLGIRTIVSRCWEPNPKDRPSFNEIVNILSEME